MRTQLKIGRCMVIVEWFMAVASGFVDFVTGIFPPWEPPGWFLTFDDTINTAADRLEPLGAWFDFTVANVVLGALVATWIICLVVKLILRGISHVPGAGGAG